MGLCGTRACNCAIQSSSLQISGDGTPGNPYNLESTGLAIVTSVTRPGSPFLGQQILETDTDRLYYWDGSAWRIEHDPNEHITKAFAPAGNTDLNSAVAVDWINLGNITVPPWATLAIVQMNVAGIYQPTGTQAMFSLWVAIGASAAPPAIPILDPWIINRRIPISWSNEVAVTPGSQSLKIRGQRGLGTDLLRADGASTFNATIVFKE